MFGSVYRYITGQQGQNGSTPKDESRVFYDTQSASQDLIRSSWCKGAIEQVSNHCCNLFDYIVRTQGELDWGHVLDAGSGSHSLEWIMGLPTTSCTALIGDTVMKNALERNFSDELREEDRIVIGNWKDPNLFKGEVFDVVIADYLVGAMDAFAPYYQDKIFDRIKPHVGKRLYVTGAEPFPDKADGNPHGDVIIEVAKMRDACILLAGERPYREFPMDWILRFLKLSGYQVLGVGFFETVYSKSFVENQISVAESKLKKFKSPELEADMKKHIDSVRQKVRSMKWGIRFGSDYVVAAVPIRGHVHTVDPNEKIIINGNEYVSSVQNQTQVYPIDEE